MAKDRRGPGDAAQQRPGALPSETGLPPAGNAEATAAREAIEVLGPGLITGASDDDPSGIATYASAGASLGYAPLWTALFTFPMMSVVQFICAKVGMVSGKGLAGIIRDHYPRSVLLPAVACLTIANTINAGTDLGAIAAGFNLLVPVPTLLLIPPIAALIVYLQVFWDYNRISTIFKWLTLALLAYVGAAFFAHPDFGTVARGTLIPSVSLDREGISVLIAILGTTISPYLFFWQASQEVEEEISEGRDRLAERKGATRGELREKVWDVGAGMFLSNLVMYFVILSTASTLHASGHTNVETAADAAAALKPLAGQAATLLFAAGMIGAGFLAVPVLTGSSAYAVSEAAGWPWGLNRSPRAAPQFYAVIALASLVGMLINYAGINPIRALFWTAVINGLLAPPMLVIVMLISSNQAIMQGRTNGRLISIFGWLTALLMTLASVGFAFSYL